MTSDLHGIFCGISHFFGQELVIGQSKVELCPTIVPCTFPLSSEPSQHFKGFHICFVKTPCHHKEAVKLLDLNYGASIPDKQAEENEASYKFKRKHNGCSQTKLLD